MSFLGKLFGSSTPSTKTPPPQSPRKQTTNNNNNRQSPTPSSQSQSQQQQQQLQHQSSRRSNAVRQQQQLPSPKCTPTKQSSSTFTTTKGRATGNISHRNNNSSSLAPPKSPRPNLSSATNNTRSTTFAGAASATPSLFSQGGFSMATSSSYQNQHHLNQPTEDAVKVVVRVRPMNVDSNFGTTTNSNNNNNLQDQQQQMYNSSSEDDSLNFAPAIQPSSLICDDADQRIFVNGRHEPFIFHRVLSSNSTQQDTYNIAAKPIINEAFSGFNTCLFAYGQTAAGKSYSMMGSNIKIEQPSFEESTSNNTIGEGQEHDDDDQSGLFPEDEEAVYPHRGLIPRLCKDIFERINQEKNAANDELLSTSEDSSSSHNNNNNHRTTWAVSIGFIEIYNEAVFDLLDSSYTNIAASFAACASSNNNNNTNSSSQIPSLSQPMSSSAPAPPSANFSSLLSQMNSKSLEVREDTTQKNSSTSKFFVENQRFIPVASAKQISRHIEKGLAARRVAETCMNDRSSRSHALFQIRLEEVLVNPASTLSGNERLRSAKINLVDLAGSENAKKTEAQGQQKIEGGHINKSLLALRQVIDERAQKRSYVSYRNSTLTKLLKDSLGGNSKTVMLACVSPHESHVDETVNTLRYASKACTIVNSVHINERSLLSPGALRPQQEVNMLTTQIQELEEQLDGEKENARKFDHQIKNAERTASALEQDILDRQRLFEIQEAELMELRRQLEAAKVRERDALSSAGDACDHFKTSQEDIRTQLVSLQKEHQLEIKRIEKTKVAQINKLEQEIKQVKKELAKTKEDHEKNVSTVREDAAVEKKKALEELRLVEEKSARREQELLDKISTLEQEFKNEKSISNSMFEDQIRALKHESKQDAKFHDEESESFSETISSQVQQIEEARKREEKTVAHFKKIMHQHDTRIKSLEGEHEKEKGFLQQRNQVLEEEVLKLRRRILEKEEAELELKNNKKVPSTVEEALTEDGGEEAQRKSATQAMLFSKSPVRRSRTREDDEKEN